ncbi:HAMP domain-containing histidine kinase [Vagococcus sp. DIV0080]|uniref:histidine kinase n=1 Tax=Candidatus Vagococcus giribetii TaxID=2230876 RepID=A0ABS3HU04_9ENTE|nr:HAMP domain-containing sensor histidine kinase [Vagococcus sp. DIV0080]MBO0477146.1 HAMP domain-containing histidine kinase [Vagococcus sp. DIV0080]
MKFKAFLFSLTLFILIFFGSLLIISNKLLNIQFQSGEAQALSQYNYLSSMVGKDIDALSSREDNSKEQIDELLKTYSHNYSYSKYKFIIYDKNTIISDSILSNDSSKSKTYPESNKISISTEKNNYHYYVRTIGKIPTSNDYYIESLYDISSLINEWKEIITIVIAVGIIGCFLFSLILQWILSWIFRPIEEVTKISKKISQGDYETRINIEKGSEAKEMAQYFNMMTDTLQNKISELENLSESRQQFVDNFSHEVRTPITSIYGYAELLISASGNENMILLASQNIMSESKRVINLSENLLYLSSMRQHDIEYKEYTLQKLMNDIKESTQITRKKKNIHLLINNQAQKIYGDINLLQSLFINLVNNATQASNNNSTIFLSAQAHSDKLTVSIQDEGKGISKEELEKIREPFYRVDSARSRHDGGAGLGLSICSQIVDLHHGDMVIESTVNKGTTISVMFTTPKQVDDIIETT